jgi:hypothetical protein
MPNEDLIREIAARACREALEARSQELAEEVARRLSDALAAQPEEPLQNTEEFLQLTAELHKKDEDLHARDEELCLRDQEAKSLQGQLSDLTAERQELQDHVRDLLGQLQARDEELRVRGGELQEFNDALRAREEELERRTAELQSHKEELLARDEQLRALNSSGEELHGLREELQTRSEQLLAREAEIQELTGKVSASDEQLRAREAEVNELAAKLQAREEELLTRETGAGELADKLSARDRDLQERDAEITDLTSKLSALNDELNAVKGAAQQGVDGDVAGLRKKLHDGVLLIANSRTQSETLEALLASTVALFPDCGLLIVRGNQATGWNCHGLTANDNFKRSTLDCSRGKAHEVINSLIAVETQVSDLDPVFVARLGLRSSARVLLVPVLLKERIAAMLLAVAAEGDDSSGLEMLVEVAQLRLDLHTYRKLPPSIAAVNPPPPSVMASQRIVQSYTVPAPVRVPPAVPQPEPVYAAPSPMRSTSAPAVPVPPPVFVAPAAASVVAAPPPPVKPAPAAAPVQDEAHDKARRFAKLLVEEIKLYNQAKVAEGRAHGDLYSRLRDDIEKSRAAYTKRYGNVVRDVDYFTSELMRILADNNPAVMGPDFPR